MWKINFLKGFKLPTFGDDFIRDPVDIAADDLPFIYKVVNTDDETSDMEYLQQWMDEEDKRSSDPVEEVMGRLVLGVLNFEPRQMGSVTSEVLIFGVQYPKAESGEATFVSPAVNA